MAVGGAARAQTSAPDDDLRARLAAVEKRLAEQSAELAAVKDALAAGVFRLGAMTARLGGFVQADGVVYSQASSDELNPATREPLNETLFLIRRARLHIDAESRFVTGVLEFDGNTVHGPVARITDVEASFRWAPHRDAPPLVMVTLGLLRIPFGFEVQEKDYVRLFLERSTSARAFFPGEFDLGVRVQGGWSALRWQVAAMNGHPSGDQQFALRDPTQSKDFLGRVGADVATGRWTIAGGVSGLWGTGFHSGTPPSKDTVVWRDTNLDGQVDVTELIGVLGQPATPSRTFARFALGGDVRVTVELPRVGTLALYGELVWASNLDRAVYVADPIAAGHDLRERGFYVAATQSLTRWAAVGLRFDRYDPDADASERAGVAIVPRDRSFSTVSAVAAARFASWARFSIEYDHAWNALGRTASGGPATLGSDTVTLRGQVVY